MNQFQQFAARLQAIADHPVCQLNRHSSNEILVRFRRRSQMVVTIYSGMNSCQLSGEVRSELVKYIPKLARPLGGSLDTVEISYSPKEKRAWVVVKFSRAFSYTPKDVADIRGWIGQLLQNTVGKVVATPLENQGPYSTSISATFTFSED